MSIQSKRINDNVKQSVNVHLAKRRRSLNRSLGASMREFYIGA